MLYYMMIVLAIIKKKQGFPIGQKKMNGGITFTSLLLSNIVFFVFTICFIFAKFFIHYQNNSCQMRKIVRTLLCLKGKQCLEQNIIYFILLRNKLSLKCITNRDNTENINSLSNYYYIYHNFYGFKNAVSRICDCFMIKEKKSMFTIIFSLTYLYTYFNRNIRNDKLQIQIYNGTYTIFTILNNKK